MSESIGNCGEEGVRLGPEDDAAPTAPTDTQELRERVEDFVRRNPAVSLALALAAGYVVGRAFARVTRGF